MLETSVERMARSQALFREINERIKDVGGAFYDDFPAPEFLCECARTECHDTIELTLAEYEAVRAYPTRFAVAPGHELPRGESVIETTARFSVVEKDPGEAAELAAELDPRRRDVTGP